MRALDLRSSGKHCLRHGGSNLATEELKELTKAIADWAADAPLIVSVFVLGSRVRGDHRADSDVDICVDCGGGADEIAAWRTRNEAADYAALKSVLPGPLKLAPYTVIARGSIVHWDRNVYCLWLPPEIG
jgi:predicted nucleotidyltransferase